MGGLQHLIVLSSSQSDCIAKQKCDVLDHVLGLNKFIQSYDKIPFHLDKNITLNRFQRPKMFY